MKSERPSTDQWLREAKADPGAGLCGMYLFHNGVVRRTARAAVRGVTLEDAWRVSRLHPGDSAGAAP